MTPALVLDTNVAIEMLSRGDLWAALAADQALTPRVQQKSFRAQCALALRFWLHRERTATLTCSRELLQVSLKTENLSPEQEGKAPSQWMGGAEIALSVNYLEEIFPGWSFGDDNTCPADIKGNEIDSWYVDKAKEHGIPLISNEGWLESGATDNAAKIRAKARIAGVTVYTSKEFLVSRGVQIRRSANLCVTRMVHGLGEDRKLPAARIYDLRRVAFFKCPCAGPQSYGVYCCPERLPRELPPRYRHLTERSGRRG
jgi:hypothetical protein